MTEPVWGLCVIAEPETVPAGDPTKTDKQEAGPADQKTTATESSGLFGQLSAHHGDIDSDRAGGLFISLQARVLGSIESSAAGHPEP